MVSNDMDSTLAEAGLDIVFQWIGQRRREIIAYIQEYRVNMTRSFFYLYRRLRMNNGLNQRYVHSDGLVRTLLWGGPMTQMLTRHRIAGRRYLSEVRSITVDGHPRYLPGL